MGAWMLVLMVQGGGVFVPVDVAALVEMAELEASYLSSFVISSYCVVVAVVSRWSMMLLFVSMESRDLKYPSNFLMMVIAIPPSPIPMIAPAREEVLMPWIAMAAAAVPKVS